MLAGVHPRAAAWAVIGTLAVVLASFSYAVRRAVRPARARPRDRARCSRRRRCSTAALVLLPFALFQLPDHAPGLEAGALAARRSRSLGTAVAQLILFRMLRLFGAARLSLVTYLMPAFALVYGVADPRRAAAADDARRARR